MSTDEIVLTIPVKEILDGLSDRVGRNHVENAKLLAELGEKFDRYAESADRRMRQLESEAVLNIEYRRQFLKVEQTVDANSRQLSQLAQLADQVKHLEEVVGRLDNIAVAAEKVDNYHRWVVGLTASFVLTVVTLILTHLGGFLR